MPVVEKHDNRYEGFKTVGPKEGELPPQKVFEGFTTPGPTPRAEGDPVLPYNEPAYVESLIAAGFPQAMDEGFRFHIYNFSGGGAPLSSRSGKKDEPLRHEDPKHKDENHRKGH